MTSEEEVSKLIPSISDVVYFTHGKRGVLYRGTFEGKDVVVKTKKEDSEAVGRILNEGKWLERLNKEGIGPKLISFNDTYVMYEYVSGEFILEYFNSLSNKKKSNRNKSINNNDNYSRNEVIRVLTEVLRQCFVMDQIPVDKEEMHHPLKHVLISEDGSVVMLDFERCHVVDVGKNVTQFLMFIARGDYAKFGLTFDEQEVFALAKQYKDKEISFDELVEKLF